MLGLQAIFILYPYLVEGSFSVLDKVPGTSDYNAVFGLVLSGGDMPPPPTMHVRPEWRRQASGYRERREEAVISDRAFETDLDCKVDPNHIARQPSKTELNRSAAAESDAPVPAGKDSWKWILLGPAQK